MIRYETLFLTIPEITSDEARSLEARVSKLITEQDGSVISCEKWGKYQLAYPVRKYDYGVYFLFRFSLKENDNTEILSQLSRLFAVNYTDLVMRHVTHRIPEYATLAYKRPESLEEAPTRDIDTFLKEHKMTGLIQEPAVKAKKLEQAAEELESVQKASTNEKAQDESVAAAQSEEPSQEKAQESTPSTGE